MKDEVLEPLSEANNIAVGDNLNASYNFYVTLAWSLAFIIMLNGLESVIEIDFYYTIVFIVAITAIAYGAELFITFHYNHQNCELYEKKIISYFNRVNIIFAITIMFVFIKNDAIYYIYPSVLFLISFNIFHIGLVLNKFYFKYAGIFNLIISICMFSVFLYFGDNAFNHTEKYIFSVIFSMPLLYMAIIIKDLEKLVKDQ